MTLMAPNTRAAFSAASEGRPATKRRPAPFSLRLSLKEREQLERQAGSRSLASYVRSRLFGDEATARSQGKFPVRDHKLLGELLGKLGASRLPNNLNQLAKAANIGTLPVTPELADDLKQACAEIAIMKVTLMNALGIKEQ